MVKCHQDKHRVLFLQLPRLAVILAVHVLIQYNLYIHLRSSRESYKLSKNMITIFIINQQLFFTYSSIFKPFLNALIIPIFLIGVPDVSFANVISF